jgi:hypothetical protein
MPSTNVLIRSGKNIVAPVTCSLFDFFISMNNLNLDASSCSSIV